RGTAKALLSGALTLGVLGYAMKGLREKSLITYGILIFFITFSIVSNAIFNVGTSMADRFMYLPSLGFCIGIAAVLALLFKIKSDELISFKFRWVVPVVLLLLAGSYKTIARNKIWKNNFELYQEDVKNAPNSARIHLYYGIELIGKHGRSGVGKYLDMAIEEISRSVKINPDFHHAHYNLAVAYEKAERFDEAIACYLNTLALQPQHIKGNLNIGLLYGKVKKDYVSAIFYFSKLLNSNYRTAYLYDNLGIAYAMNGNLTKAAEIFQKGIEYNPNSSKLHLNMAITLDNLGRKAESKAHYDRAFALDPKSRRSNTSGE
ncbi:MAG TPA: tetratricopeptide repeat protein, partial [Flavobacteriales bacterium]|nr:tetratricopeptide repeat protein [Flavobacteriales bacterium]